MLIATGCNSDRSGCNRRELVATQTDPIASGHEPVATGHNPVATRTVIVVATERMDAFSIQNAPRCIIP